MGNSPSMIAKIGKLVLIEVKEMFGFFKHKKEKDSPAPQLIVHTEKTYEKKLPTISDERITLSVNALLDGKYTYAQVLLENFFYVNAKLQKTIARSLLEMLNSLSAMSDPTILTPATARKPRRYAETSEKLK